MNFCAWDAALSKPVETGGTLRTNYALAAAAGNPVAQAALAEPPFPFALEHLWRWHCEIRQGLGYGMEGLASLTWVVFDAWARWTGNEPYPHEVSALFALDAIARNPDAFKDASKALG